MTDKKIIKHNSNIHLELEIDSALYQKLKYVAENELRSTKGLILYLIREHVRKFENENEPINHNPDKNN